jgi:mycofactocin precursor peptide peptidase
MPQDEITFPNPPSPTGSAGAAPGRRAVRRLAAGLPARAPALADMCWPDVDGAPRQVLVVPVGSLEQHGPHLPLDTDTRIAVEVARRGSGGRPGTAIAPALTIGASGEHAGFPGTLSIGGDALATCLIELGRHASLYWAAMLLVNGHGGNAAAIGAAAARLRHEGRTCAVWHAGLPGGDAHAGRFETSIMLALAPEAVRLDAAAPGNRRPLDELMPVLRDRGVRAVSANGVLGDPSGASAGEGVLLLARLTAGLSATLDVLLGRTAEPRGTADPRGTAEPRGTADPRETADPRGTADPGETPKPRETPERRDT